jgi:ketosteroid isomerase-like protein
MIATLMAVLAAQTSCHTGPEAAAIEAQRAAFNTAIAEADIAGIDAVLAEDVILRAGTSSTLYAGREAQIEIWAEDFAAGTDRLIYVRTPDCIEASPLVDFAFEYGHWRGTPAGGGTDDFVAGRYTAKWALQDGNWRLDAELFLTTDCAGALCPAR